MWVRYCESVTVSPLPVIPLTESWDCIIWYDLSNNVLYNIDGQYLGCILYHSGFKKSPRIDKLCRQIGACYQCNTCFNSSLWTKSSTWWTMQGLTLTLAHSLFSGVWASGLGKSLAHRASATIIWVMKILALTLYNLLFSVFNELKCLKLLQLYQNAKLFSKLHNCKNFGASDMQWGQ